MNHQVTMTLGWFAYYFASTVWVVLLILLLKGLFKKEWNLVKRISKYIINSIVFLTGWMFYLELALIVKAPILVTKQAYIKSLKEWIWNYQFTDILISSLVVLILVGINLLFFYKIENKKHKVDLLILTLSAIVVLAFWIWFTGEDSYYGLLEERNRH